MKLIFTGLIALCTVTAAFADEGKFGPAWVEGHNYKVVDGQLVDLGPAPAPTPTPTLTPSPTPAQPTIIINNNVINSTPAPLPTPAPAQTAGYFDISRTVGLHRRCMDALIATTTSRGLPLSRKTA